MSFNANDPSQNWVSFRCKRGYQSREQDPADTGGQRSSTSSAQESDVEAIMRRACSGGGGERCDRLSRSLEPVVTEVGSPFQYIHCYSLHDIEPHIEQLRPRLKNKHNQSIREKRQETRREEKRLSPSGSGYGKSKSDLRIERRNSRDVMRNISNKEENNG